MSHFFSSEAKPKTARSKSRREMETPLALLFADLESGLATTRRMLERVPEGRDDGFGTPGAYQPASHGGYEVLVTKLNPAGSTRLYTTYLGGSVHEWGDAIAVDAAHRAADRAAEAAGEHGA